MCGLCAKSNSTEWKAPAFAEQKKNPLAMDAKSIAAGKTTWMAKCAQCHGAGGKGDGDVAKVMAKKPYDLTTPELQKQSDGALYWKITVGKKPMPSFITMKDEERWQLVNYIRSLAKSASADAGSTATSKEQTTSPVVRK
jgi:mono/diheme cytochrome c family protein